MKKIEDVLKQGYSIQIYTKYNEKFLINLLKPSLNKIAGSGICGRGFKINYMLTMGDIFGTTENFYIYKKKLVNTTIEKYNESTMKSFVETNYVITIPMDIVLNILEKEKKKYENLNSILHTFYQNEYIIMLFYSKYQKVDPLFTCLLQILTYCKIHCIYWSYLIIHEVYLENLLTHVDLHPLWNERFKHFDNYLKLHCDIVSRLKDNHYVTKSILYYKNKLFEKKLGPSYCYRKALLKVINE
jgi:hypothetical protein